MMKMHLTGIRDLDLEILKKLDDRELGKICLINKYFQGLCKNKDFWRNRTIGKFSKYLGNIEKLNRYREKLNLTWKLYYTSLIEYIEDLYKEYNNYALRQDLQIIRYLFKNNYDELLIEINDNFDKEKWKEILKRELIVPNSVFSLWDYIEGDDKVYEVVNYVLSLDDRRIDPNISLIDILNVEDPINITLDIRKRLIENILKDKRIDANIVLKSIEKFLSHKIFNNEDSSLLNIYLDFIKSKGELERLREIIRVAPIQNITVYEYLYQYD